MTRADAFVNFTFAVSLLAPGVAFFSFRLPKDTHRKVQVALLAVCWLAVLVLEARIRVAGGSGSLIAQAPVDVQPWARRLLLVHVSAAVLSYGLWTGLAVVSWRRWKKRLPGPFSPRHRALGWAVFAGLCFDAVSATGMYALAFVA